MKNNEQHAIDQDVRHALESIEVPYNADHWQLMVGKLDALDADDTEFDQNVAEKLARVEIPFQAANWADMVARLEELDHSEAAFDVAFSQRIDNIQARYQPLHWQMMAEKIEETFSWRARIVRYKVVEVALVLLTLFTVGNMIDLPFDSEYTGVHNIETKVSETPKSKKDYLKKAPPQKATENKSFYNPSDWRNRPTSPKNAPSELNTNGKPIAALENTDNEISNNIVANSLSTNSLGKDVFNNTVLNKEESVASATPALNDSDIFPTKIREITEGGILAEIPMRKVKAIGKVTDGHEENEQEIAVGALALARVLQPMDILKPSLLNTRFYDDEIVFPRQKEKRAKWRLNVFGLPVADLVSYNYIKERIYKTQKQTAANLGGGVAVGYKKNKLEIETGLTYLDKKYDLPNVEIITGNLRSEYKTQKPQNLRLSIVSIPLSMNYAVKETHRWRFYTRLGVAFNTILRSKEDEFVQTSNSSSISTNTSAQKYTNVDKYEGNLYPKGIFEGGLSFTRLVGSGYKVNKGLKGNSYLTANAGLGIEYRLTHKVDIYLQPTFDYHFSKRGIGTLNDRINSFSVQGGVKTKLK